ncbi:MAG TPA: glycosyltransferase family 4 protein [Vicinamibacterales bacterium]|jgi:hypothetical protein|nr:glycosyltransferase [Acidobacteriota bacterium]HQX82576.1 glycosyltransferase family 4 protein [Vicinamibacterales bacterium]
MKVLFPVEVFYPSQAGGAANSVYWMAKYLAARGFEPTVIASNKGLGPDVPLNRWNQNEAGRVMHVRTASLTAPIGQTLRSLLQVYQADVVHLSSLFYPAAFVTAFAARVLKKKLSGRYAASLIPSR